MNIGMRIGAWSCGSTPTARDYVQDGLIAMWDGIENSGWGKHDAMPRCIDLMGRAVDIDGVSIGDGFITYSNPSLKEYNLRVSTSDWTVEFMTRQDINSITSDGPVITLNGTDVEVFGTWTRVGRYNTRNLATESVLSTSASDIVAVSIRLSNDGENIQFYKNGVLLYEQKTFFTSYENYVMRSISLCDNIRSLKELDIFYIRVYVRKMSAQEIAANYAIDKARFGLT